MWVNTCHLRTLWGWPASITQTMGDEIFRRMSEQELLQAARGYDGLTDEAQAQMRGEFTRRGLEAPMVDEPEEPEELVTVRRYRDLSEGIVARSLLESVGMRAELRDENLIRLDWQISNFIGGLRLQVPAEDAANAEELLSQAVVDPVPLENGWEFAQPVCPVCGSKEITFEGAGRGAAMAGLWMMGLPLPKGKETWRCEACGARWEDGAAR